MSNNLKHHGVKGQKWGVRRYQNKDGSLTDAGVKRYKDDINSQVRTIKKGTEVQTISKKAIDLSNEKSRRSKRLYASYTDYDKDEYINLMGNFMYEGTGAYKNTFMVKKDMKVASDQDVVKAFMNVVKKDPEGTARDIARAYNENHKFFSKSEKTMSKKISQLTNDPQDQKSIKMAEMYVTNAVMGTKSKTTDSFYSHLVKQGFDAMSDTNDRKSGAQDPLIILNMKAIEKTGSVRMTSKDLEAYWRYTMEDEHTKKANDVSQIQR